MCLQDPPEAKKRVSDPLELEFISDWEWELKAVGSYSIWMLRTRTLVQCRSSMCSSNAELVLHALGKTRSFDKMPKNCQCCHCIPV